MKNQKNRLLCLGLIFILLICGMCLQVKQADSVSLSLQNISEKDTIERKCENLTYIGNSTHRLIVGLRDVFRENRKENQGQSFRNTVLEFLFHNYPGILFFCCCTAIVFFLHIEGSEVVILEYIHDQDGEK